jgi:hypothetical protein
MFLMKTFKTGCAELLSAASDTMSSEQVEQVSVIMHSATILNLLVDNVYAITFLFVFFTFFSLKFDF